MSKIKALKRVEKIYNSSNQEKQDKIMESIFKKLPLFVLRDRLKKMPTICIMDDEHQHVLDIAQKVYNERIKRRERHN